MNIPDLPSTLKKNEWQKHSSIVAKVMPGKSWGISEALAKGETTHAAFKQLAASYDPATADVHKRMEYKKAGTELGVAMVKLHEQAAKSATVWKAKLCPVPKTTREYAEKIAATADTMRTAIDKLIFDTDHAVALGKPRV